MLAHREARFGVDLFRELSRRILLQTIDAMWKDHLSELERLEEGIGLGGFSGIDPLLEWRREATRLWQELLRAIRERAVQLWFLVEVSPLTDPPQGPPEAFTDRPVEQAIHRNHPGKVVLERGKR